MGAERNGVRSASIVARRGAPADKPSGLEALPLPLPLRVDALPLQGVVERGPRHTQVACHLGLGHAESDALAVPPRPRHAVRVDVRGQEVAEQLQLPLGVLVRGRNADVREDALLRLCLPTYVLYLRLRTCSTIKFIPRFTGVSRPVGAAGRGVRVRTLMDGRDVRAGAKITLPSGQAT